MLNLPKPELVWSRVWPLECVDRELDSVNTDTHQPEGCRYCGESIEIDEEIAHHRYGSKQIDDSTQVSREEVKCLRYGSCDTDADHKRDAVPEGCGRHDVTPVRQAGDGDDIEDHNMIEFTQPVTVRNKVINETDPIQQKYGDGIDRGGPVSRCTEPPECTGDTNSIKDHHATVARIPPGFGG